MRGVPRTYRLTYVAIQFLITNVQSSHIDKNRCPRRRVPPLALTCLRSILCLPRSRRTSLYPPDRNYSPKNPEARSNT